MRLSAARSSPRPSLWTTWVAALRLWTLVSSLLDPRVGSATLHARDADIGKSSCICEHVKVDDTTRGENFPSY